MAGRIGEKRGDRRTRGNVTETPPWFGQQTWYEREALWAFERDQKAQSEAQRVPIEEVTRNKEPAKVMYAEAGGVDASRFASLVQEIQRGKSIPLAVADWLSLTGNKIAMKDSRFNSSGWEEALRRYNLAPGIVEQIVREILNQVPAPAFSLR